jgi:Caspase domain
VNERSAGIVAAVRSLTLTEKSDDWTEATFLGDDVSAADPAESSASVQVDAGPTLLLFATGAGRPALDSDDQGGNPFASALVETARDPMFRLRFLETRLRDLTFAKSLGIQEVERFGDVGLPQWRFIEDADLPTEKRRALLLIVSDYPQLGSLPPLAGAARDEQRLAAMLAQHRFAVDSGVGSSRNELMTALRSFGRASQHWDIGVIYATGHGVEVDGNVYLIPGDYPSREGFGTAQLKRHAISVARIASAASARSQNVVFFGGCREAVPRGVAL